MNRLDRVLARGKTLVTYLCVGDPSVDESVELALGCARAGADVLELGVPFSDPTADGPAIARASQRAIRAGGGLRATLRAASRLRAELLEAEREVAIVLFGYYNPLFVAGEERVVREAAEAGVDALLVVDLPIEESAPLRRAARAHDLGVVPLLAPTSRAERVAAVKSAAAEGGVPFVYYVSTTGVTGAEGVDAMGAGDRAAVLRAELGLPVVVGFGIDSGEKARAAAAHADGAVVGTALVRAVEEAMSPAARLAAVERLVLDLRAGVDAA